MFRNSRINNIEYFNGLLDHGLLLGLPGQAVGDGADDHGLGSKDSPTFAGLTITGNSVFGLNSSVFQPATDSTTFFQVLDAAGAIVGNFDTTNKRFGIRTAIPLSVFHVIKNILTNVGNAHRDTSNSTLLLESSDAVIQLLADDAGDSAVGILFSNVPAVGNNKHWLLSQRGPNHSNRFGITYGTSIGSGNIFGTIDNMAPFFTIITIGNIGFGGEIAPETLTEWTHAQPYLTLHNSTHEDTDGGGESRLIFKREDGAGTETACFQFEASHDGVVANDQLGKGVWSVNTGAGLVDIVKIDGGGNTYIGDAGTTNYSKFEADGTLVFNGTATVWDDLQFTISDAKVPAANFPTWETFTTNTKEYSFAVDDYIDTKANEISHAWKQGTTGHAHLHVTTKAANSTGSNRYAKFTIYLGYCDTDEIWQETSLTAELTIPDGTSALQMFYLDMGNLTLTNYLLEAEIKMRVNRIIATGGTEYSGNIFLTQAGIHFEYDTGGSRAETTK